MCTCVVHKRCHLSVVTKCPGMKDEVSVGRRPLAVNWRDSDVGITNVVSGVQTSASSQPGQRFSVNIPHRFVVHNYKRFTFCDHCGSLLYGLIKQGLQCEVNLPYVTHGAVHNRARFVQVCSLNVHKRCQKNVANNCGINPKQMAEILNEIGISPDKTPQRRSKYPNPTCSAVSSSEGYNFMSDIPGGGAPGDNGGDNAEDISIRLAAQKMIEEKERGSNGNNNDCLFCTKLKLTMHLSPPCF